MSHRLRLEWRDGRVEEVVAGRGQSVLEAAEEAGVALPAACRYGACARCTGRLLDGEVEHRRSTRAFYDDQQEDGYVLTCIAVPTADCRLEVGEELAEELYG